MIRDRNLTAIERVLRRLHGARATGNGWQALCPAHADRTPSLSIAEGDDGRVLLNCFAGCTTERIVAALRLRMADLFPDRAANRIIAAYDYRDETGALLYQVTRYEPKTFRLRRPGDDDQWVWDAKGVRRVLYRLPQLRNQRRVVLVEGEKDADRLWSLGIPATTSAGGANSWRREYAEQLQRAGVQQVVILPDNDDPGRGYAAQAEATLREVQIAVATLEFSDLPEGGDVSDWLDAGGDPEQLKATIGAALTRSDHDEPHDDDRDDVREHVDRDDARPTIDAADLDLPHVSALAWQALLAANDPPTRFQVGTVLSRLESGEGSWLVLRPLNADRLRYELARDADWVRYNDKGEPKPALPPMHVVRDMFAYPDPPLPPVERIVGAPVFAAGGSFLSVAGYHASSRLYYAPDPDLVIPEVAEAPSAAEVARARALILNELLHDFPFTSHAERAHAVALLLQPFLRELIPGCTPLYLIEKPAPGTGAGLLVQVLTLPALGHAPALMTEGRDEDEWRKRLTAKLVGGPTIIVLDNLRRRLDSAALSAAITAPIWEDRLLGQTQTVRTRVRCTWIATGNNPALSNEMARRTVRIRLDARIDRPWLRGGFKHDPLREWAAEHRGELIWATLTLGQAWLAAGRPRGGRVLGEFEGWARVLGGVLDVAGIPGFLGNLTEFYELSDAEGAEIRGFLQAWWERWGVAEVGVEQLFALATSDGVDLDLDAKSERGQRIKLGVFLRDRLRDRRYTLTDNLVVEVSPVGKRRRGSARWKLMRHAAGPEQILTDPHHHPHHSPGPEDLPPLGGSPAESDPHANPTITRTYSRQEDLCGSVPDPTLGNGRPLHPHQRQRTNEYANPGSIRNTDDWDR